MLSHAALRNVAARIPVPGTLPAKASNVVWPRRRYAASPVISLRCNKNRAAAAFGPGSMSSSTCLVRSASAGGRGGGGGGGNGGAETADAGWAES